MEQGTSRLQVCKHRTNERTDLAHHAISSRDQSRAQRYRGAVHGASSTLVEVGCSDDVTSPDMPGAIPASVLSYETPMAQNRRSTLLSSPDLSLKQSEHHARIFVRCFDTYSKFGHTCSLSQGMESLNRLIHSGKRAVER